MLLALADVLANLAKTPSATVLEKCRGSLDALVFANLDEEIEEGPRAASAKALGALARKHLPEEELAEIISAVDANISSSDWGERQGAVSLLAALCAAADWERCSGKLGGKAGGFLSKAFSDDKIPVRIGAFMFCASLAEAASGATGNKDMAVSSIKDAKALATVAKELKAATTSSNVELLSAALTAAGHLGGACGDEARKTLVGPVFHALQQVPACKQYTDEALRLLLCVEEGNAESVLEMLSSSQSIQAKEVKYLTEYVRRVTR